MFNNDAKYRLMAQPVWPDPSKGVWPKYVQIGDNIIVVETEQDLSNVQWAYDAGSLRARFYAVQDERLADVRDALDEGKKTPQEIYELVKRLVIS